MTDNLDTRFKLDLYSIPLTHTLFQRDFHRPPTMSPSLYTHTFTWPPTPSQSVVVTGTFDNWSGDRHHLYKNEAKGGYWEGTVDIPFGEKVAYKYVVDGNWLIREDEAKEWGESWSVLGCPGVESWG